MKEWFEDSIALCWVALVAVLLIFGSAAQAQTAIDYTQSMVSTGATQAKISFKPTTPATLVDVHYNIVGMPTQSFRMANSAGTWTRTVNNLSAGKVVEYWFTYEKRGPLYVTPHFKYTHGGGGSGGGGGDGGGGNVTGRFPINFVNNTRGIWRDDQIYIWGLSLNEQGVWCYMKPDGSLVPMRKADESAPNRLTKNGRNYANYAFTVAQAKAANFRSWTHIRGGRLYISLGSPVYIPVDDNAWGGPDLLNPNDPNHDVYYDWYEYTYVHNTDVAFGGNTGMVDQFGIPLTARVVNAALGFDVTKGMVGNRATIMSQYQGSVPPAFRGLANTYRVKAPYKDSFRPGGANANYLQPYIDQVWAQYMANEFSLQRLGDLFVGRVINNRLQFTKNGVGPFFIDKPSTFDVFACTGTLARGAQTELELEAELCAAFNRGVAQTTSNWANPSAYYTNALKNEYAAFWHKLGIGGKAYAFAYDDVNDQSSVIIMPNLASRPYPDSLTISIGW